MVSPPLSLSSRRFCLTRQQGAQISPARPGLSDASHLPFCIQQYSRYPCLAYAKATCKQDKWVTDSCARQGMECVLGKVWHSHPSMALSVRCRQPGRMYPSSAFTPH